MCNSKIIVAVITFFVMASFNIEAKLYKWVDNDGVTHYGEVIPPEYATKDKEHTENTLKSGKNVEIMNPEMIRAKEEEGAKRQAANKEMEEKAKRDNALLNTYSSEKEIDLARDRSLQLISARIESNKILLKSSKGTLLDLKDEEAVRIREGKNIPSSLHDDIALAEDKVSRYQVQLGKSEEEYLSVKTRFENDKILYRKIILMKPVNDPEKSDYPGNSDSSNYPDYQEAPRRAKKSKVRASY